MPRNPCAGAFGAVYSFYMERPPLARIVGRLMWGIDTRPFYASMDAIAEAPPGATILDVPCGAGVAFRALAPAQEVRYLAVDVDEEMLRRARQCAERRVLDQVELVQADMCELPFEDRVADIGLSYSGLHCVEEPERALAELARCLRPGGRLVGSTFLSEGSRRQRAGLNAGRRRGQIGRLGTARELRQWLEGAGIRDVRVEPDEGFAVFSGRRE